VVPPEVPDTLPCPEGGEPSKVLPHTPIRFPGIDPHQTRVIRCSKHGKQKVAVKVDSEANEIVPASEEEVRISSERV